MCPEAYDPLVRRAILAELKRKLGSSLVYHSGYPEAKDEYMRSIISDLGKGDYYWIQERIFRYLLPASFRFPNKLYVYVALFFNGIKGVVVKDDRTASSLINRLIALTENDSDKTRLAALNILKRLSKNYELISSDKLQLIEQKALSTKKQDISLQETKDSKAEIDYLNHVSYTVMIVAWTLVSSLHPSKKVEFKEGDTLIIERLSSTTLEAKFLRFDNINWPNFIFYRDKENVFSSLSIHEIFRVTI